MDIGVLIASLLLGVFLMFLASGVLATMLKDWFKKSYYVCLGYFQVLIGISVLLVGEMLGSTSSGLGGSFF